MFLPFGKKYNNKHVSALTSLATKYIHGSSRWKVIHLRLRSRISNAAGSISFSKWCFPSIKLKKTKNKTPSLSYSNTNLGFHLSEENETITNRCLFGWQVYA